MENNMKAMREALEVINCIDIRKLKRLLYELVEADIFDGGLINQTISAIEKARRALALPPRNCDVGTADEQETRFAEFCDNNKIIDDMTGCDHCDENCPVKESLLGGCSFRWAQMPYNESEEPNA